MDEQDENEGSISTGIEDLESQELGVEGRKGRD